MEYPIDQPFTEITEVTVINELVLIEPIFSGFGNDNDVFDFFSVRRHLGFTSGAARWRGGRLIVLVSLKFLKPGDGVGVRCSNPVGKLTSALVGVLKKPGKRGGEGFYDAPSGN